MVVLTTSETTTSRMLAVLSYTTVTGGNVAAVLAGLGEAGGHGVWRKANRPEISFIVPRQINTPSKSAKTHPAENPTFRARKTWRMRQECCLWRGDLDSRAAGGHTDLEGGCGDGVVVEALFVGSGRSFNASLSKQHPKDAALLVSCLSLRQL